MKLPDWPLQKAVYERLSSTLSVPVYDEVPEKAKLPYVLIGESTGINDSTKTTADVESTLTIYVYSGAPGMRQVKELMSAVVSALTDDPITLTDGWAVIKPQLDFNEALRDPDGATRHGVIRIRVKVSEV